MTSRKENVLVIFDLVSTLTDAAPRYVQAFADVCESYGKPVPSADELREMLGNKNLGQITDHFMGPLDDDAKKKFMGDCNSACDALLTQPHWEEHLYPHVAEAIEVLALRGVTLGIYTGTREDALEAQLAYHDIGGFFDRSFVRGKDNARDGNRNSRALKAAQLQDIVATFRAKAGDANAKVLVIGDSSADAEAAADAGLLFAGFAVDDKKRDAMAAAGVQNIMRDFGDLPDLVERLIRPVGNDNAPPAKATLKPRPQSGPKPR